jgi:hypothetical protein
MNKAGTGMRSAERVVMPQLLKRTTVPGFERRRIIAAQRQTDGAQADRKVGWREHQGKGKTEPAEVKQRRLSRLVSSFFVQWNSWERPPRYRPIEKSTWDDL